jgi:hypothetical protein
MRLLAFLMGFLLLSSTLVAAPEIDNADENAVINAAIQRHFTNHLPYVKRAVVMHETLPLDRLQTKEWPADGVADYEARNKTPLELAVTTLPNRISVAAVGAPASWEQFTAEHGDAWLVRVARPGFVSPDVALVRIDVVNPAALTSDGEKSVLGSEFTVKRTAEGWQVLTGTSTTYSGTEN